MASRAIERLPVWLNEGIAEFYSTFESMDGGRTVQLGRVPVHHLERLRHEFLPLATLAAVDHASPYYNERDKGSAFYAESWAFVHFLCLGKDRKYGARFAPFVETLTNGVPFERACAEQLGTPVNELEREVRQYLGSLVFTAMRGTLPESLGAIARLEPAAVAEAEAHSVLAELQLFHDRSDEGREQLTHALTLDPTHALALARLAEVSAASGKADEARALLGRGISGPGATYLSACYRARALDELGVTDTAALVSAWRE